MNLRVYIVNFEACLLAGFSLGSIKRLLSKGKVFVFGEINILFACARISSSFDTSRVKVGIKLEPSNHKKIHTRYITYLRFQMSQVVIGRLWKQAEIIVLDFDDVWRFFKHYLYHKCVKILNQINVLFERQAPVNIKPLL